MVRGDITPITNEYIEFCTSNMTGVYIIDIRPHMMDVWTKTALKRF